MEALLLSLAGGAVALYCLWQLRRWLGEAEAASAAGPQRLEALVDELLVTAEATAAVVQEKAEALEAVIARADERVAALGKAVEGAPVLARPAGSMAEARPAAAALPEVPVEAPVLAPEPPAAAPAPQAAGPDLHERVAALADAGLDVTAIARQMGLTKGEVQLVLGLRRTPGGVQP